MFKSGNIVKLRSGGPTMTVDKVNNGKIACVWFKDQTLKNAIFRKDTLVLVEGKNKAGSTFAKSD